MTRLEREDRSAELMADFEQQAASIYDYDKDEVWRAAMQFATQAAEEASQRVDGVKLKACGLVALMIAFWHTGGVG